MSEIRKINLRLFDGNTNVTTDVGLSDEMKTFYEKALIKLTEPKLVHDQFGQKKPIPRNGGKTIEFRKYSPLPKLLTPLTEGVTPDGQKLNMSVITATVDQYGGYVELSDILLMTAIDNNLVQATELLAGQAGRTLDTITREELVAGTNVIYSNGAESRAELVGGSSTYTDNCYLTVDDIKKAVRALKVQNAEQINGNYVVIIHPDCTYDLTKDSEWLYPHQYVDTENIYSGEIGRIAGCRFVETTEAKVFHAEGLTEASRNLTISSGASGVLTVAEAISADEATALVGRTVIINDVEYEITASASGAAGSATVTVDDTSISVSANDVIYPGEAGADGRNVYATLVIAANAYGVTDIEGGGLEHIVKQLGSAGTGDPLNQRATAGWKATKVAKRLVEQYMVRIESTSTFDETPEN